LLTIALATSGAAFALPRRDGLHLALTRPRALAWLALPIGLYLAWYVTFGATRMVALRSPSLDGVPEYVLAGLVASAAASVGSVLPVVGSLACCARVRHRVGARAPTGRARTAGLERRVLLHRRPRPGTARCGAGAAPRYVYVAAPGLLIAGAVLLARIQRPVARRSSGSPS
jgi:hypothetical protein